MTRRGKKRLLILVTTVTLIGTAAVVAYFVRESRRTQQLDEAYRNGMAAYEAGDFESALRGLAKSLEVRGDDPEVLYRVADSRSRLPVDGGRHLSAAISPARDAANLAPDDKRPLELLLELYRQVGFITERLEIADRLLKLDPSHFDAHRSKIECLTTLGRTSESRAAVDALIEAHPQDARGHELRVQALRLEGTDSGDVLKYIDTLVLRWPENLGLATLQIKTFAAFGLRDEARAAAQRAVSLSVPDTEALLGLVRALDMVGMRPDADRVLDRAANENRFREEVFAYLIERAWKAGQADRARAQAQAYSDPLSDTPSSLLGWMALANLPPGGEWETSPSGTVLSSRTDDDAQYWIRVLQGREGILAGNYPSARENLLEALTHRRTDGLAWSMFGEVAQRLGEPDLAVPSLEEAVRLDPTDSRSHMMLAASLLEQGRPSEARIPAERAAVSNPGVAEALTLARVYIALLEADLGDVKIADGAVSIMEELAAHAPDQPDVQAILARTYLAVNHLEKARTTIEQISRLDSPPSSPILLELARSCDRLAPQLVDPLLATLESFGSTGPALLAWKLSREPGTPEPASVKATYKEAIESATDSIERMRYELALARFLDVTDDAEALAAYKRLSEEYPDRPEVQQSVLDSRIAWSDEATVETTIKQLRSLTGDQGSRWRLAEAQRQLAFHPGEASAAKVVMLLAPLTQAPTYNIRALMLTSDALRMLDDRSGAIQMLVRAIERQPDNPLLYVQTIELLQAAGRSIEAGQRLREFLSLGDLSPGMRRRRIDQLDRQAMWSEAIRDCEELVAETEEQSDLARLASLCANHNRVDQADQIFKQLLAGPTLEPQTRTAAAEFYARLTGFDRGVEILEPLQSEMSADDYLSLLAGFHERHNREEEAVALLRSRAESSGKPEHWAMVVELQVRMRAFGAARQSLQSGLVAAPTHATLVALGGVLDALDQGRLGPNSVEGILTALVDENLRPAMTRIAEAMLYLESNPNDVAGYIVRLEKAVDAEPALLLGWQLLTAAHMNSGRADQAVTAAQTAARILPASVRAAELLASTLAGAGRLDEARLGAVRWRELDSEVPSRAALLLAEIELSRNRPDRALTEIEPWIDQIVAEAAEFPTRLGLYAGILIQSGGVEEAHELLWPHVVGSSDWALLYIRLAAEIPGDTDVAIEWVDRAQPHVSLTPESQALLAQVRANLGQLGGRPDQFEQAVVLLEPLAAKSGTPPQLLAILAGCYQSLGEMPKAEAMYRQALKSVPADPVILNNLAYLLSQSSVDGDSEALELSQRAIRLAREKGLPANVRANLFDTLGMVHLSAQRLADAEQAFRDGLELNPQSAMLRLGSAEALALQGRHEDARREYQTVARRTDLDNRDADLAERLRRISALLN